MGTSPRVPPSRKPADFIPVTDVCRWRHKSAAVPASSGSASAAALRRAKSNENGMFTRLTQQWSAARGGSASLRDATGGRAGPGSQGCVAARQTGSRHLLRLDLSVSAAARSHPHWVRVCGCVASANFLFFSPALFCVKFVMGSVSRLRCSPAARGVAD